MLIVWIVLWVLAFIIMKTNSDNRGLKWLASLNFFSGMGGLCTYVEKNILPYIDIYELKVYSSYLVSILFSLVYTMGPYSMVMFGISSSQWLKEKAPVFYKHSSKILLIFPAMTYFFPFIELEYLAPFLYLSLWAFPYCAFGNFLIIQSYLAEKKPRVRRQWLAICLLVTPATTFSVFTNYILRVIGINDLWKYSSYSAIFILIIFIIGSMKDGVLGIRFRFEKYKLENIINTVTSGTSILNHTIKNEITKLSICEENIKQCIKSSDSLDYIRNNVSEDFQYMEESFSHLLDMTKRIQDHLQDIYLNKSPCKINTLMDQAVSMVKPYLESKKITVQLNYEIQTTLMCDPVHIKEMFCNILKNSIEAVNEGGYLSINIYCDKKWITVSVSDNGKGISKENLAHVLDPFFSTKRLNTNFGLGLSYCYNVIQQHGGNLEILSKINSGTTVHLNFKREKEVSVTTTANLEKVLYE